MTYDAHLYRSNTTVRMMVYEALSILKSRGMNTF